MRCVIFSDSAHFTVTNMAKATDLPGITTSVVKLLEPLESHDRKKIIRAALTLLDEDTSVADDKSGKKATEQADDDGDTSFNAKAKLWIKKNGLTAEQLAQVFHVDGENVEIILDTAPGNNQKQQTINAYLLTGTAGLLRTGEPKFDDKTARDACRKMGCYSDTNHATYIKKPGNILSGTKESGWALTGPGQKTGAELIKGLTTE